MTDKKALNILKKSRRYNAVISDSEREICREHGVLWEKEPTGHDELIRDIRSAAERISTRKAVMGFLYSISSGDYRYRTALSSLIWAKSLPDHDVSIGHKRRDGTHLCSICGARISDESGKAVFDEMEYHSIRLIPQKEYIDICCAPYVLCDLEAFEKLPDMAPCDEDIRILNRIFGLAGEISPGNKVNALLALIAAETSIKLTAADAYSVLGVLSSCGIFDTPENKSYWSSFVNCADRGFLYERDIYYPLNHWHGKDGINYPAVKEVFGEDISRRVSPETVLKGDAVRCDKKRSVSAAEDRFRDGEHIIDMNDRYRHYYGLSPLEEKWDKKVIYSVTHGNCKRTEIFFDGDVIKKFIYEEKYTSGAQSYLECDTDAPTKARELLLPKTSRGREKNITPSLLQTPTYMNAHLIVNISETETGMRGAVSFNSSNDQQLPLPFCIFRSREDFVRYTEDYILSCPHDYDRQLDYFINKKRRTIKFTAGDIFRIQTDASHYTYCLILGKVRQILKWDELPEAHPLRYVMAQPILYRQYGIITERADMTADELSGIPLLPVQIAQDNEVLWETYPIVDSKRLTKDDIDLGFMLDQDTRTVVWGLAMHTFDKELDDVLSEYERDISASETPVKTGFMTYAVALSIRYETAADNDGHISAELKAADSLKSRIAEALRLDSNAPGDSFAERYDGITREKYIELAEKRFRR